MKSGCDIHRRARRERGGCHSQSAPRQPVTHRGGAASPEAPCPPRGSRRPRRGAQGWRGAASRRLRLGKAAAPLAPGRAVLRPAARRRTVPSRSARRCWPWRVAPGDGRSCLSALARGAVPRERGRAGRFSGEGSWLAASGALGGALAPLTVVSGHTPRPGAPGLSEQNDALSIPVQRCSLPSGDGFWGNA